MDILTKIFTFFTGFMIKFRLEWEKSKQTIIIASITGLVVGILIGWLVIGWGLFPVQWSNVSPAWMRDDFKAAYLASVAEDYTSGELDALAAKKRLGLDLKQSKTIPWTQPDILDEDLDRAIELAKVDGDPYKLSGQLVALQKLRNDIPNLLAAEEEAQPQAPKPTQAETLKKLAIAGVVLLAAVALLYFIWWMLIGKDRQTEAVDEVVPGEGIAPVPGAGGISMSADGTISGDVETEVDTFHTPYVFGDDFFDPSFSIEVGKNFLGECGIGISETIGAGDPKHVTAFEAWLFDKSDIRTITTILASPYAIDTPGIKDALDPKGDVIPLEAGKVITLETTSLKVEVTIEGLDFKSDAGDGDSVFQSVNFKLQAWVKPGATLNEGGAGTTDVVA